MTYFLEYEFIINMFEFVYYDFINFDRDADGYDPLDISGNVTIQWDIMQEDSSQYNVSKLHFIVKFLFI